MRQAQKMEAIGKLTGGIAHDFNNLLAVIILQVDMLNLQLKPDNPMYHRIGEIKSAANRAASLTKQLLAFSRKQMLQPRPTNLNRVISGMDEILHRLIGEDIELKIELAPDLGVCLVDPDQMSQVLMNLVVNARDAMPDGGSLMIKTANVQFSEETRSKFASQPAGNYVELTVADTGCGMDAATQERIFEPFFTTKEAGKGTGLGLSTAYGIVKQSEGFIWLESEVGKGTSFKVQLPVINKTVEQIVQTETPPAHLIGRETILLVEDEKVIRGASVEVLRMFGYSVLAASNGDEALEIAKNYEKPIHLLVTDVVMPKMNGKELAERIKAHRPEINVLYMSGYTDDIIARHGVLEEGIMFLEKPFTPSALGQKVREALKTNSGKSIA